MSSEQQTLPSAGTRKSNISKPLATNTNKLQQSLQIEGSRKSNLPVPTVRVPTLALRRNPSRKAKINSEAAAVIDEETGKTAIERIEDKIDVKMAALNAPATSTGKPF